MRFLKSLLLILIFGLFLVGCKKTETVTVTFMNGDTEISSAEVVKGADATAPADPSKVGFVFTGWDKAFTDVEADLVVNAVFAVQTFEVQFMVDGAPFGVAQEVNYGEDAVLPNDPIKVGFVFDGWDIDATDVTEDLEVNATFVVATYTVIFRVDGVQEGATQTITHGEAAVAPADPTKVGHTFVGWDAEFDEVTSDLIISAEFAPITYTVRFYEDELTMIGEAQTVAYGQAAIAPIAPEKVGFVFEGWDQDFSNITGDLDVVAEYVVATFTVKFMVDGVQVGADQVIQYGNDAVAPSDPTKNGYNFTGWSLAYTNVTSNLTVVAEFSIITYEIKYYDGAAELTHTPATYTVTTAVTYTEYAKTGFLFRGWYETDSLETETTGITLGSTGNVTVYGKWLDESLTYTVNYTLNDGSWNWTTGVVTTVPSGDYVGKYYIDGVSNLPEIFMQDYYTYLSDNSLLEASTVHANLRKTNWADFSADYADPVAIYNWTSSVTSATPDGYSQFFWTSILDGEATGGFFGTEPYKSKYINLATHLWYMFPLKYATSDINSESGKALAGFILDGYFYGTQSHTAGSVFETFRMTIPTTTLRWNEVASESTETTFPVVTYIQGLDYTLALPSREGYFFKGWYDNSSFTGDVVTTIEEGVAPASMYYAKWEPTLPL